MAGLVSAAAAASTSARTKSQSNANKLKAASAGLLGSSSKTTTIEEAVCTLRLKVLSVATGARLRAKKGATVANDRFQAVRKAGSNVLCQNNSPKTEAAIQHLVSMGFSRADAEEMSAADAIATAQLLDVKQNPTSTGNIVQAQVKASMRNVQASVTKTKLRVETIIGKPVAGVQPHHHTPSDAETYPEERSEVAAKRQMVYEATERRLVQVQARNGGTMEDWRKQQALQKTTAHRDKSSWVEPADGKNVESQSPPESSNAGQDVWLGAEEMIVSDNDLAMQRAIAASLGSECAVSVANVVASSSSSSSSGSCSLLANDVPTLLLDTSSAPDGSVLLNRASPVPDEVPKGFAQMPSIASWLLPLPFHCEEPSANLEVHQHQAPSDTRRSTNVAMMPSVGSWILPLPSHS